MRRIKLALEYDGTNFHGWQLQAKTLERTVQGVLLAALAKLPGEHKNLKAAGRTDAGVHAVAMVAHLDTTTPIPNEKLALALNAHLPEDVRVYRIENVNADFDAQFDCLYRRYVYKMKLARDYFQGTALERGKVLFLFQKLNVAKMQEAARLFEGTHDFTSLATQETRETTRTIYLCELEHKERELNLHIAADGFLRNMVRAVVGTLLEVGEGKLQPSDITRILNAKDRSQAGQNVPPYGLYFVAASYKPWENK
ncbi:MAG: tRNA pseudouridine(38-40) synthase TruA [Trueperaceae bacterium]